MGQDLRSYLDLIKRRRPEVIAFVTLRPGATAHPDEFVEHCRERLAAYKSPRRVVIVDELPKSGTGKVLKSRFTPR